MKAVSLRTNYRVTVPANCVAELVLPGQAARFLTSGCHSIEV